MQGYQRYCIRLIFNYKFTTAGFICSYEKTANIYKNLVAFGDKKRDPVVKKDIIEDYFVW